MYLNHENPKIFKGCTSKNSSLINLKNYMGLLELKTYLRTYRVTDTLGRFSPFDNDTCCSFFFRTNLLSGKN